MPGNQIKNVFAICAQEPHQWRERFCTGGVTKDCEMHFKMIPILEGLGTTELEGCSEYSHWLDNTSTP